MEKKAWDTLAWKNAPWWKRVIWWHRDGLVEVLWKIGDIWDWWLFPPLCRIMGGHRWKESLWGNTVCLRCAAVKKPRWQ